MESVNERREDFFKKTDHVIMTKAEPEQGWKVGSDWPFPIMLNGHLYSVI